MAMDRARGTPLDRQPTAIPRWLTLAPLAAAEPLALLLARLATGIFIIHGVWDNVTNGERMAEFIGFMRANGFVPAELWAPFSVYTQLIAGALLIPGLLMRWAGIILTITFVVALVMVHWDQSLREWWPALALVALGLLFATRGAGPLSLDAIWSRKAKAGEQSGAG
jgi:putative oxidoreductase